jgi:hypothetical protein
VPLGAGDAPNPHWPVHGVALSSLSTEGRSHRAGDSKIYAQS